MWLALDAHTLFLIHVGSFAFSLAVVLIVNTPRRRG